MRNVTTEQILDECINRLKHGESVEQCLNRYPRSKNLHKLLSLMASVAHLPPNSSGLRQEIIWKKISSRITPPPPPEQQTSGYLFLPFFKLPLYRLATVVVIIAVSVGLIGSTAVISQKSIPGQPLYQVKRTVEQIELVLTIDDIQKVEVQLQHAEKRLHEAKSIIEQNSRPDSLTIKRTLSELTETTTKVVEQSTDNKTLLKKVVELANKQQAVLSEIETKAGSNDTKQAISKALDTSIETKTAAEKSLAKLESEGAVKSSSAAATPTTTAPLTPSSHATSTEPHREPTKTLTPPPTSTIETLKALGGPGATTTTPTFISPPPPVPVTTTPEVLPMR